MAEQEMLPPEKPDLPDSEKLDLAELISDAENYQGDERKDYANKLRTIHDTLAKHYNIPEDVTKGISLEPTSLGQKIAGGLTYASKVGGGGVRTTLGLLGQLATGNKTIEPQEMGWSGIEKGGPSFENLRKRTFPNFDPEKLSLSKAPLVGKIFENPDLMRDVPDTMWPNVGGPWDLNLKAPLDFGGEMVTDPTNWSGPMTRLAKMGAPAAKLGARGMGWAGRAIDPFKKTIKTAEGLMEPNPAYLVANAPKFTKQPVTWGLSKASDALNIGGRAVDRVASNPEAVGAFMQNPLGEALLKPLGKGLHAKAYGRMNAVAEAEGKGENAASDYIWNRYKGGAGMRKVERGINKDIALGEAAKMETLDEAKRLGVTPEIVGQTKAAMDPIWGDMKYANEVLNKLKSEGLDEETVGRMRKIVADYANKGEQHLDQAGNELASIYGKTRNKYGPGASDNAGIAVFKAMARGRKELIENAVNRVAPGLGPKLAQTNKKLSLMYSIGDEAGKAANKKALTSSDIYMMSLGAGQLGVNPSGSRALTPLLTKKGYETSTSPWMRSNIGNLVYQSGRKYPGMFLKEQLTDYGGFSPYDPLMENKKKEKTDEE